MGQLTTADRVKGALRIPAAVTIHDARIAEIIEEVEDDILHQVNLTAFGPTTYSERLDTEPGDVRSFVVSRWPLLSVVALTYNDSLLVENDDFYWRSSGQVRMIPSGALLSDDRQNVHITYTAGLVSVVGATPAHLIRWATLEAALQYNVEPMGGLAEVSTRPTTRQIANIDEDRVRQVIQSIAARYVSPLG
jgi:hypothetical protein